MINVEVCYALPDKQRIIPLQVEEGTTVAQAAELSMDQWFPGIELATAKMGIFGKAVSKPAEEIVREGDRVEIYRPLIADPKEVRKIRAAKVKAEKATAKKP